MTAWADGRVQGVGFRAWVRTKATGLGLTGSATNLDDGQVEIVAEGPEPDVRALLAELKGGDTPGRVTRVTERWGRPRAGCAGSPRPEPRLASPATIVTYCLPSRFTNSVCKVNNRG